MEFGMQQVNCRIQMRNGARPRILLRYWVRYLYMTLVRQHVKYCSSARSPFYKKDKELIEKI